MPTAQIQMVPSHVLVNQAFKAPELPVLVNEDSAILSILRFKMISYS